MVTIVYNISIIMSKLERIATLIAVVEENGFAAAARKKEVSTAAISRQITALEGELGVKLLKRTTRQVALTLAGETYYQQCKNALRTLQEAENAMDSSKKEAVGDLHIMTNRYFAQAYLIPKLPQFMKLNPKLNLHFHLAERFPHFEKEAIDILFGVSIEGSEELVRRRVATTRYILCASPDYLQKNGIPKNPSDIGEHAYITHSMRKPNNQVLLKNGEAIPVNPTLWLNDSYVMRECAMQGMGLVNLHDYIVADAIKEGGLVEILSEYQEPKNNVYLYYQQSRFMLPKIRRFIDFYVG